MPFEPVPVTTEDFKAYLSDKHGNDITFQNLVEASDHFNCSVATVKKRLNKYKKVLVSGISQLLSNLRRHSQQHL